MTPQLTQSQVAATIAHSSIRTGIKKHPKQAKPLEEIKWATATTATARRGLRC
jgi:hypothetical protein